MICVCVYIGITSNVDRVVWLEYNSTILDDFIHHMVFPPVSENPESIQWWNWDALNLFVIHNQLSTELI